MSFRAISSPKDAMAIARIVARQTSREELVALANIQHAAKEIGLRVLAKSLRSPLATWESRQYLLRRAEISAPPPPSMAEEPIPTLDPQIARATHVISVDNEELPRMLRKESLLAMGILPGNILEFESGGAALDYLMDSANPKPTFVITDEEQNAFAAITEY